jgi:hypothetical protein
MEEGAEPKEYEQLLEAGKQILSQMHEKEHSLFFSFLAVLGFRLGALNLFCRCSTTYTIPQPFLLHFLCEVKFVVWEQFQTLILLPMPPSSWDYRHMSGLLVEMGGGVFLPRLASNLCPPYLHLPSSQPSTAYRQLYFWSLRSSSNSQPKIL